MIALFTTDLRSLPFSFFQTKTGSSLVTAGGQQLIAERYWEADRPALWATVSRLRGPHTAGSDPTGPRSAGVHLPRRSGAVRGWLRSSGSGNCGCVTDRISTGQGKWWGPVSVGENSSIRRVLTSCWRVRCHGQLIARALDMLCGPFSCGHRPGGRLAFGIYRIVWHNLRNDRFGSHVTDCRLNEIGLQFASFKCDNASHVFEIQLQKPLSLESVDWRKECERMGSLKLTRLILAEENYHLFDFTSYTNDKLGQTAGIVNHIKFIERCEVVNINAS